MGRGLAVATMNSDSKRDGETIRDDQAGGENRRTAAA
jgi:hypothetical protein